MIKYPFLLHEKFPRHKDVTFKVDRRQKATWLLEFDVQFENIYISFSTFIYGQIQVQK